MNLEKEDERIDNQTICNILFYKLLKKAEKYYKMMLMLGFEYMNACYVLLTLFVL